MGYACIKVHWLFDRPTFNFSTMLELVICLVSAIMLYE